MFVSVCSMAFFRDVMGWMILWSTLQEYGGDTLWLSMIKDGIFPLMRSILNMATAQCVCVSHVVYELYFT